jgi:HKD family nuclease
MNNRFITNKYADADPFGKVLQKALKDATRVDIAVSYLQMSGWHLLKSYFRNLRPGNVRVLTTDQLGITHPSVLSDAISKGIKVKSYSGGPLYHPKLYLAYGSNGSPERVIVGSANISASGFETGIEAGIELEDESLLRQIQEWFDHLFADRMAKCVDSEFVRAYEIKWKSASTARAHLRRVSKRFYKTAKTQKIYINNEDFDVLDDVFSTIKLPVGTLGFDHAGNNIRNLSRALEVLSRFPQVNDKERSELHLLGFLNGTGLTMLGKKSQQARTEKKIAEFWCRWIHGTTESILEQRNRRLVSFRRAANQFWRLKPEVYHFFITNILSAGVRPVLQTIELLCNGSDAVRALSLDDFRSLAPIILDGKGLPEYIREAVADYRANKGSRSWISNDREVILKAYKGIY